MANDGGVATAGGTAVARTPDAAALERWPVLPCPPRPLGRDVALDLLRGLAMLILVVNHAGLRSWASVVTGGLLSAAEVLVPVSGVAVGMVFGGRWQRQGGRVVTRMLWARARTLYVASVATVTLVGLVTLAAPGATAALTTSRGGRALYAVDGPSDALLAVLTLQAGPWQTCILAFFVATLIVTPALLWALRRGAWLPLLLASVATYLAGRRLGADVLPSQSEGPFPLLVWQVLFVPALVAGYHRPRVAAALARRRRAVVATVAAAAVTAAALRLGLAPEAVRQWRAAHFDKATLDPLRVLVMLAMALGVYVLLRRHTGRAERLLGPVLLPLGRCSFYVFIVHVPLCALLAAVPAGDGGAVELARNTAVTVAGVGAIVVLVRRQVLFRWIPR